MTIRLVSYLEFSVLINRIHDTFTRYSSSTIQRLLDRISVSPFPVLRIQLFTPFTLPHTVLWLYSPRARARLKNHGIRLEHRSHLFGNQGRIIYDQRQRPEKLPSWWLGNLVIGRSARELLKNFTEGSSQFLPLAFSSGEQQRYFGLARAIVSLGASAKNARREKLPRYTDTHFSGTQRCEGISILCCMSRSNHKLKLNETTRDI